MDRRERQQLDRMFNPRGVALFGGVGTPASFGQLILLSQVRYGYKGRLYPISGKGGEIAGLKIFRSLAEVDGPLDLASVSVPAGAVPGVLEECLRYGVAGVQIHSSGFAETGEGPGRALETEIARIAARGVRVVGPNCFGIHSPRAGITLLPGFDFSRKPGSLAFISQSGGVATDVGYEARSLGLGISKVVSFGNGCDLDAAALLDYLADDPETETIAAYLEGVRDGRRFLEVLRRAARQKPVIIWKSGLTPLGGRAALSHTGSMGGRGGIWESALSQAGALSVKGLDEIMDTLVALKGLKRGSRKIALMGGGGAIGVFSSDLAHTRHLDIPVFCEETQTRLRRFFPTPGNSMANPLDTGSPALPPDTILALAEVILKREPIDVLVVVMLLRTLEVEIPAFHHMRGQDPPPQGGYLEALLEPLADLKRRAGKDLVMVFDNRAHLPEEVAVEAVSRRMRRRFQGAGIPVFASVERALRGIGNALSLNRV